MNCERLPTGSEQAPTHGQARLPPTSREGGQASQRLPRKQRLIRSSQFEEAYAQNRKFVGRFMVLWLRQGEDASLRLGVVASRKVGKAVERNRAKRRLREVFRLNRHALEGTVDVVLVARRTIVKAKWEDIKEDLLSLLKRAGLLRAD